MKTKPMRGSHLPVLMRAVAMTRGPVLELGCGIYSTGVLHWMCFQKKRRLVTYESNPRYYDYARQFDRDFHEVRCIDDWDAVDLSEPWSVAFVDHAPDSRRANEVRRLAHAEYVVVHDTDNATERKYRYMPAFKEFAHRYKFNAARPHTSILSNVHDVADFMGDNP